MTIVNVNVHNYIFRFMLTLYIASETRAHVSRVIHSKLYFFNRLNRD